MPKDIHRHDDTAAASKAIADWREAVARNAAAADAVSHATPGTPGFADLERASRQAIDHMLKLAREAWKAPVTGWADIVLRAEIAQGAYWPDHHGEGVRQLYALFGDPSDEDTSNFGERAIVHLLKAILGLGVEQPEPAWPMPTAVPGPALIWRAILGMRGHRDKIEIGVDSLTEALDRLADRTGLTAAIEGGWDPEGDAPAMQGLAAAGAGLDELLGKARQGVTALRTIVKGWEREHGPHRPFYEGEGSFLASLEYCADGIEATVNLISDRIDEACEGRPPG
jgi:hypothetical protein